MTLDVHEVEEFFKEYAGGPLPLAMGNPSWVHERNGLSTGDKYIHTRRGGNTKTDNH